MPVGIGYDVHALGAGRELILGGVHIPFELGLIGHSDADVLVHAIIDALLGAAALGDIGQHFPDNDQRWKGASSLDLLNRAYSLVRAKGYELGNTDSTLIMERPKIAPYIPQMRRTIATALGVNEVQVSIKATTNERLGFIGRQEGVAAMAVVMLTAKQGEGNE